MTAPHNPLGIHAGVWVGDWSPASARYAIEQSAAAGFDLIEIPAVSSDADHDVSDPGVTLALLRDHGLDAVVSLALGRGEDINTTDAHASARGERRLLQAVAFAHSLGAPYVGGVLYSMMGKYDLAPSAQARDNSLAVLGRVARVAAESGIELGLEYVNRYESNLLNTAAKTVQFIHDLAAPNVVLHLDTFHANLEEPDQATAVRDAGPLLGYIHAAENHRGGLGTGSIDWPGLFRQLALSDYRGPITFESFSGVVQPPAVATDIGLWRDLWTDPHDLARQAHTFLTAQLAAAHAAVPALASA
ncbi:sugar phosphate isomerase/epimerase [Cryobacterium melibiosiphilum]|uniref:Sugar phosphate isomerase/epimerase n=1 Tax=Cryobacterium melibiosiphilum TaxID=995039 RepID=A0A3A5MX16_9MICO|nr:sugar phosphate isomerase/epimerase [Cryobacterium melibiosiphilum]RJT89734.1 sugar phosphate isomerase/epimerase [Cryobacterium melibiosiphilum]